MMQQLLQIDGADFAAGRVAEGNRGLSVSPKESLPDGIGLRQILIGVYVDGVK